MLLYQCFTSLTLAESGMNVFNDNIRSVLRRIGTARFYKLFKQKNQ